MTTIQSQNNTYYYFGKHTGHIEDGYFGSGRFVESAKKSKTCKFSIVALCYFETSELAYEFEELLVDAAMSEITNCVNLKPGGLGGYPPKTEEELLVISEQVRERWADPDYKERVSNSIRESWENEEHRQRMKAIHTQYNASQEVRDSKSRKNRKYYAIENYGKICKNPTYEHYDEFLEIWLEHNRPSYYKFLGICNKLGYNYTSNNFRALVDRFKRAYDRNEIDQK